MARPGDRIALTNRFYATLSSLQQFHDVELRTIIAEIPIDDRADDRQKCVIATYYRIRSNVESILTLNRPRDVQAVAMLSRSVLELAIDLRLMKRIGQATERMIAFADAERLRAARALVDFKRRNPASQIEVTIHSEYIRDLAGGVDAERLRLWPNIRNASQLKHWSGMNLADRANEVDGPFPELYQRAHSLLSWYTHAGLAGILNLPAETFTTVASQAFAVAMESYNDSLDFIIREFPFRFQPRFLNLLAYAKRAPWTDTPEQARDLRRELRIE